MSEINCENNNAPIAVSESRRPIRLVYVLAYRATDYIRSQSLLDALGNCTGIELVVARNRSKGIARYYETWRALIQLRKAHAPDIYVLGFRGHEMFWPVRWLTNGRLLVFDALMSPSAALREENKARWLGRLLAPLLFHLERGMLRRADLVLTDTQHHVDFYIAHFGLSKAKILAIPVGAIETRTSMDSPITPMADDSPFNVLFYGSMLPLHGVDVIVAAAARLTDLPIRFNFIGGSARQAKRLQHLCSRHWVTNYTYRRWLPLSDLVNSEIPHSDVCLGGPFGGTPQALRVITSKTSQALALGKATVIGAIDEDIGWIDKENCLLVPQANPDALADALRWAFLHRGALQHMGSRGKVLYEQMLSVHKITKQLCPALHDLLQRSTTQS